MKERKFHFRVGADSMSRSKCLSRGYPLVLSVCERGDCVATSIEKRGRPRKHDRCKNCMKWVRQHPKSPGFWFRDKEN